MPTTITTTDHTLPHISTVPANAGESIELFVREHDGTLPHQPREPVLMLHGRSVPALAAFDLGTGRYNWARELAQAGFDVFMMELQGSGRSPRPKMDDPCNANPTAQVDGVLIPNPLPAPCPPSYPYQLNNSLSDWNEVDTVIDFIRSQCQVDKVALVGYSAAGFQFGPYTVQHPEKVSSLFLLAPIFRPDGQTSKPGTRFDPPFDLPRPGFPMNIQTKGAFKGVWDPEVRCAGQREDGMIDVVWEAIMSNDEIGRTWGPVETGQPQGVMRIRNAFWWGWNNTTAGLDGTLGGAVPVFLLYGEFDTQANNQQLNFSVPALYDAIPGAHKLIFKVACAGHQIVWERQAKVLHQLSKQWLKHTAINDHTNGSFIVDEEGEYTPA